MANKMEIDSQRTSETLPGPIALLPSAAWSKEYLSASSLVLHAATLADPEKVASVFSAVTEPTRTPSRTIHIPDPVKYDGKAEHLKGFLEELAVKINYNVEAFPTEGHKVAYAFACLEPEVRKALGNRFSAAGRAAVRSLDEFVDLLTHRFDDPARQEKADLKLDEMKQRGRNFLDFHAEFETTLAESSYADSSEATKIHLLRARISRELNDIFHYVSVPTEYEAFVRKCHKKEAAYKVGQAMTNPGANKARLPSPSSSSSKPPIPFSRRAASPLDSIPVSKGGNMMDLDAVSRQKGPDGRLTEAAKRARLALRRCLRCNETGHIVRTCPLGESAGPAKTLLAITEAGEPAGKE